MYPGRDPHELISAIFPTTTQQDQHPQLQNFMQFQSPGVSHPPQGAAYMQPPPVASHTASHPTLFRGSSDNSLSSALTFSTASASPSVRSAPPSAAHSQTQGNATNVQGSIGPANSAASNSPTPVDAGLKKKSSKLRQSKLGFLPGVAQSTIKQQAPPAPTSSTDTVETPGGSPSLPVVVDLASEPGTPPLPPAKALAVKPSVRASNANGSVGASGTVTAAGSAVNANAKMPSLSDKARQPLSRLSVERTPQKAAHAFVQILSDLDPSGKFMRARPTGAEDRRAIIDTLHSIVQLETGKGYTDSGRKRFFASLMALPAARQILSTWLRSTVPPKKVTEAVPDHSRRYRDTLIPLLSILEYVDMKLAYLKDQEAGIGKAMTGVSARAVDPSARKMAASIRAKWTKMITDEDAEESAPSAAASSSSSTPSVKRKPADGAAAVDTSSKRYKTETTAAAGSASIRKPQAASASSSSTNAKPGLSFFNTGNAKKPATASGSSTASAASGSRQNAHQDIMSLVGRLSGASSADRAAATKADAALTAQSNIKVKKRVRWREDSELVAVKVVERVCYGQDDDDEPHVEGAGDTHGEGLALGQSVTTMEALMEWREPREVLLPMSDSGDVGSESMEGPFQTQRKANLEEKISEAGGQREGPDESELEQPGTISEMPADLMRSEAVEIPTPWMEEPVLGADEMDVKEGMDKADTAADAQASSETSPAIPSSANLSELLAKVGQSVGGVAAGSSNTGSQGAPAAALNFDVNQLQSILTAAQGSGANSNAVNSAMVSSNVTSDGLSSLLSSLSRSNGSQIAPSALDTSERPSYWQQTYRANDAGSEQRQESYPGEFHQDYRHNSANTYQPPGQSYGLSSTAPRTYRYGNDSSWDSGPSQRGSRRYTVQCKFFAQGNCRSGDSCNFRH
ncbi:zinc finger protein [Pseudozyma hubeiensis SY62]|uniref:Zinc finger protein n=1 Tax=Pseudozyma hubeiensis (strain SY62) TaxID=1305764 RepID=R9P1L4_PSEHS|nr:zinc finger protein [Pseudozyma hubeiensis SY62]GAC95027.1 zinc finger protein [Pseudozyma hubeiensis SY62]